MDEQRRENAQGLFLVQGGGQRVFGLTLLEREGKDRGFLLIGGDADVRRLCARLSMSPSVEEVGLFPAALGEEVRRYQRGRCQDTADLGLPSVIGEEGG